MKHLTNRKKKRVFKSMWIKCITCGRNFNTEGEAIDTCLEFQPRLFKIKNNG
jgi:hypothetical protein